MFGGLRLLLPTLGAPVTSILDVVPDGLRLLRPTLGAPLPVRALISMGMPMLANRVPSAPPDCVFVGLILTPLPVWREYMMSFFCFGVKDAYTLLAD